MTDNTARGPQTNWFVQHFARYRTLSPWAFCWRVTLEGLVVSLAVASILYPITSEHRTILNMPWIVAVVAIVVVAPVIETFVFQAAPIALTRLARARQGIQITIATALFAAAHFAEGPATGLAAGVVGGFYFAFTFATWLPRSFWTALWVTTASHLMHNAAAILLVVVFAGGWPGNLVRKLDYTAFSGGWASLSSWYFWEPDGEFTFAIVGPIGELRSLHPGTFGHYVAGSFQLTIGGTLRTVTYDLDAHILTIADQSFDLRQANAIYVESQGGELRFDARLMHIDADLFRRDGSGYFHALVATTFHDYAQADFAEHARKALGGYLKAHPHHVNQGTEQGVQ